MGDSKRKTIPNTLIFVFIFAGVFSAFVPAFSRKGLSGKVLLPKVPGNTKELLAMRKTMGRTPPGAAALFIASMLAYGKNPSLGLKFFTLTLDRSNLSRGTAYKGFAPGRSFRYYIRQMNRRRYLGGIYIRGTTVAKKYEVGPGPHKIEYTGYTKKGNRARLYIRTTSGNLPRPMTLQKNNRGIWKVRGASSFFVGAARVPRTGGAYPQIVGRLIQAAFWPHECFQVL